MGGAHHPDVNMVKESQKRINGRIKQWREIDRKTLSQEEVLFKCLRQQVC